MVNEIFLLGAYDRYNYGDLLFPVIVEGMLKSRASDLTFHPYALIESDLSAFGARRTLPIREFYRRVHESKHRVVIVAGGGVLGASWGAMRFHLSSGIGATLLKVMTRILGPERFDAYCQKSFASPSKWPWVVDSTDFGAETRVLYNAVGGSYLGRLSKSEREAIVEKLSSATFISVRDSETKRLLNPIDDDNRVKLVPDSAVVMSHLFAKSQLAELISASGRQKIESKRPYFCFQMGLGYAQDELPQLAEALDSIAEVQNWDLIFLPIGRAQSHEDHIALRQLQALLKTPVYTPSDTTGIYEVMALIAHSQLFIGTSLHGAVTSQSYAIPHLGLAGVAKLEFYLDTWEIPLQKSCAKIAELQQRVAEVVSIPKEALKKNRDRLVSCAMRNFEDLAEAADIE